MGGMIGDYTKYNLSSEPLWAQFIYEVNLGLKLSKNKNIWLDAGILPSHIGFESAVSADCYTPSRSLLAETSPYYEMGFKLSFRPKNEKLSLAILALNGWQRIRISSDNVLPALGLQVQLKPNKYTLLNYSNFIGKMSNVSFSSLRFFHNVYVQFSPNDRLGLIAGLDLGMDKYNVKDFGLWYSPVVILRIRIKDQFFWACRGEFYGDPHQIIISTSSPQGFQTYGFSTNIDYLFTKGNTLRIEFKTYYSKDPIFKENQQSNYSLMINYSIKL